MYAYFTVEGFERQFGKTELRRIRSLERARQRNIRYLEKGKKHVVCECGAMITYSHLSRHRGRNTHNRMMGLREDVD